MYTADENRQDCLHVVTGRHLADGEGMLERGYTFDEMRRALVVGWGEKGARVAECWLEFNTRYFEGRLLPLPIFLTPATPYGKRLAWTCCAREVTHIALAAPGQGQVLIACRSVLLHE